MNPHRCIEFNGDEINLMASLTANLTANHKTTVNKPVVNIDSAFLNGVQTLLNQPKRATIDLLCTIKPEQWIEQLEQSEQSEQSGTCYMCDTRNETCMTSQCIDVLLCKLCHIHLMFDELYRAKHYPTEYLSNERILATAIARQTLADVCMLMIRNIHLGSNYYGLYAPSCRICRKIASYFYTIYELDHLCCECACQIKENINIHHRRYASIISVIRTHTIQNIASYASQCIVDVIAVTAYDNIKRNYDAKVYDIEVVFRKPGWGHYYDVIY